MAAILPFVLAVAGVGALITGNIINTRRDANIGARVEEARKLAGPRTLNDKDQNNIKAALEPFRGTSYDLSFPPIVGPAFERPLLQLEPGSYLINHLIGTLASAGWELRSVEGSVPKTLLPSGQAFMSLGVAEVKPNASIPNIFIGQITGVSGVKICWPQNDEKLLQSAEALAHALNKAQIWTDFDLPPPNNSIPAGTFTSHAVHVVIGTKPF